VDPWDRGIRFFLSLNTLKQIYPVPQKAKARRMKALVKDIEPVNGRGGLLCFDGRDLYWAFSRVTIGRMGSRLIVGASGFVSAVPLLTKAEP
jgi:hypothetical protein